MIDYAILRLIWWLLLGVLLAGFAIFDGFDLGVAALLPFVARNDLERRVTINTVGPVWEGNQVWIILGAGAIFAAWPAIYAISFSGFYLAMLLLLATFIIRPVAFKYRSKLTHTAWRTTWDWLLCCAGLIAALVFGVAIGNVIQGVPFHFDVTLRGFYTGTFFALFNPFALLCGLVSVVMLLMHGAAYLTIKTQDPIQSRAKRFSQGFALLLIVLFVLAGLWICHGIKGYVVTSILHPEGPSNPLHKHVITQIGAWMKNYNRYPWMLAAPILGIAGALLNLLCQQFKKVHLGFVFSALSVFGIVFTVGLSLYPFILPSSSNLASSLTVWDASSSQLTLMIMLVATCLFLPIIIAYTSWVYWVLRGKVTNQYIQQNDHSTY